jgi:hypothetical protein
MNFKEIQLATIADGKAISQFNFELARALENCRDIATEPTAQREVTLRVKIKPSPDRSRAAITFQASSKICPDAPGEDQVFFSGKSAFVSSARQLTLDEAGATNVEEIDPAANTGTDPGKKGGSDAN